MNNVISRLIERLEYDLSKMRKTNRRNYWYEKALKDKRFYKEYYPECAKAIDKEWNDNWHRKFMQAQTR